ncbi:S16 family serine protease [Candidatus Aenigmatarchaeota archaeon]
MKTRILALIIGLVIGAFVGGFLSSQTIYIYEHYPYIYKPYTGLENGSNTSYASVIVPAVDQDGKGVATILDVQVVEGYGRTLTNIDKLLFWTDTQNSIRTARAVAEEITGSNMSDYDLIYTIKANATVIEGASAGAALTVATVAALENIEINSTVMLTGTINHDGTIGPVGEVLEKAIAAKAVGAQLFLVPLSQSTEITYESERYCEQIGWSQICTIEQIPKKIDIAEEAGIRVLEVRTVEEALEHFMVE